MADFTVIFGHPGTGKNITASSLTRGKKVLLTSFGTSDEPISLSTLLHARPECVIVDECPLEHIDILIRMAKGKIMRIQHPVTGLREIDVPQFFVIVSNAHSPEEVLAALGGRGLKMIECKTKEVWNG